MEKIIHNVETQEVTFIALTSAEIEKITKQQVEAEKLLILKQAAEAAKAAQKAALLNRLGLTEAEAALLLS